MVGSGNAEQAGLSADRSHRHAGRVVRSSVDVIPQTHGQREVGSEVPRVLHESSPVVLVEVPEEQDAVGVVVVPRDVGGIDEVLLIH